MNGTLKSEEGERRSGKRKSGECSRLGNFDDHLKHPNSKVNSLLYNLRSICIARYFKQGFTFTKRKFEL